MYAPSSIDNLYLVFVSLKNDDSYLTVFLWKFCKKQLVLT